MSLTEEQFRPSDSRTTTKLLAFTASKMFVMPAGKWEAVFSFGHSGFMPPQLVLSEFTPSSLHLFNICTEENPPATAGGTDIPSPLHPHRFLPSCKAFSGARWLNLILSGFLLSPAWRALMYDGTCLGSGNLKKFKLL